MLAAVATAEETALQLRWWVVADSVGVVEKLREPLAWISPIRNFLAPIGLVQFVVVAIPQRWNSLRLQWKNHPRTKTNPSRRSRRLRRRRRCRRDCRRCQDRC